MAKILVADDNSNVQKTMALALADLGVEVVSVNNGEAAVRKLADVSPDLVLADIFMPVRNGYEVCEYIKKDPRFSHVPVILLVGAFDPLDEREAQRVGADGILKKPFVPPEPLITMVKTLLDRSMNERLVAVPTAKASVAVPVRATGGATLEPRVAPPPMPEAASLEEFHIPGGRVTFGEGEIPVAFGQLLETPPRAPSLSGSTDVIEPVDDEHILTSSRDATLGEPVFWRNDSPDEVETEHAAETDNDHLTSKWSLDEAPLTPVEDTAQPLPVEPVEIIRDDEESALPSRVDSERVELDPAAQAPLNVESGTPPELAANPLDWMATAPPQPTDVAPEIDPGLVEQVSSGLRLDPIRDAAVPYVEHEAPSLKVEPTRDFSGFRMEPAHQPEVSKSIEKPVPVALSEVTAEFGTPTAKPFETNALPRPTPPPPIPQAPEDTARSILPTKWADLTGDLDNRAGEVVKPHVVPISVPSATVPPPRDTISQPAAAKPLQPPVMAAPPNSPEPISPAATTFAPEPVTPSELPLQTAPAVPDPALVEAVVQRVLDKMRPQVVDIITKEFLRPVVQALVNREIEKH